MPRLYRGYDGVADVLRTSPQQNYGFWFDNPEAHLNLRDASIQAARQFGAEYGDKEIVILYSGGMDSEWLCESFWQAGVPFTPLIVDYCGLNAHDLYWAQRWIDRREVKNALTWTFDLKSWYGSEEQFDIARVAQMAELAYTGQFKAMLQFHSPNRIFLSGYDEPVITADDSGPVREWNLTYNERHYAIHKFLSYFGLNHKPGGWLDANVFDAYVKCPTWQMLVANQYQPQIWNSELVKVSIYRNAFRAMEPRVKYTGFENMLETVVPATQKWRKLCREQYGTEWLQDWSRPIKDVWRELNETDL